MPEPRRPESDAHTNSDHVYPHFYKTPALSRLRAPHILTFGYPSVDTVVKNRLIELYVKYNLSRCPHVGLYWAGTETEIGDDPERVKTLIMVIELTKPEIRRWGEIDQDVRNLLHDVELDAPRNVPIRYYRYWHPEHDVDTDTPDEDEPEPELYNLPPPANNPSRAHIAHSYQHQPWTPRRFLMFGDHYWSSRIPLGLTQQRAATQQPLVTAPRTVRNEDLGRYPRRMEIKPDRAHDHMPQFFDDGPLDGSLTYVDHPTPMATPLNTPPGSPLPHETDASSVVVEHSDSGGYEADDEGHRIVAPNTNRLWSRRLAPPAPSPSILTRDTDVVMDDTSVEERNQSAIGSVSSVPSLTLSEVDPDVTPDVPTQRVSARERNRQENLRWERVRAEIVRTGRFRSTNDPDVTMEDA